MDLVEEAIVTFEVVPDAYIDFQGGGLCGATDPDTLRIIITTDDAVAHQRCDGGEWNVTFGGDHANARARIFHELGHALGFKHEYIRRAGTGPDGPGPNDCIDDPALGGGAGGGDNAITEYDVYSVLNSTYCHNRTYLSSIDKAGLAYVYPGATADRFAIPFSFPVAGGFLTGADDNAPIEFAQRLAGVWEFHYSGAQWSRITTSGTVSVGLGGSLILGAALGTSSEAQIRAEFTDEFGRQRTSPTTTIRQDPGLAAALILSALSTT